MNSEILSPETKNEIVTKTHSFIWEIFDTLIKALILILIVLTFGFRMCTVVGSSMQNTLQNGEKLIITSLVKHPQARDIIVFHETSYLNEPVVKRVIAVGGDTVNINPLSGKVFVNDVMLDEPYIDDEVTLWGNVAFPLEVPEGTYFVMGDNRDISLDSRSSKIGCIDERYVLGEMLFRIYNAEEKNKGVS
jgi:signal peptidase I